MAMPHAPLTHRADLQGLRALAITLVVLAHAGMPGLAGGFVGVDVFFVLSGYLITRLLVREYYADGQIRWMAFIARRLRRLLPALLTMLTLVVLMAALLLSTHEFSEQTASAGYAATWTSNLFFAFTTFDYFAELHLRDLFLHTWSLGVEEQFYLFWPVFLLSFFAVAKRYVTSWNSRTLLLTSFGALFAGSFILSLYWSSTMHLWAFYLMPSRIWQFALGAGIFAWFEIRYEDPEINSKQSLPFWISGCSTVGILLIIGSAIFLHSELVYPGIWALFPSVGAAMVIASGSKRKHRGLGKVLSHPGLVWIGDRSYSWYLWHWPLLMLGFAWGLKGNPVATIALVLLSFLFAMMSYRWVELPFWKGRFSEALPAQALGISLLAIAVVAVSLVQTNLIYRDNEVRAAQLGRSVRLDMPAIYRIAGCDTWFSDATVQPCILGNPDAEKTAVLFGDSIGAQWYSLLPEIFATEEWRLLVLTKSSCAMVDEDYFYDGAGGIYEVCTEWRNRALDYLSTIEPDAIFVGSAATYDFSEEQWTAGTRRILNRLTKFAAQVMVIPGTPQLSFDGPGCLERWLTRHDHDETPANFVCREPMASNQASRVSSYLRQVVKTFDNANVLDLNGLVCPDDHCAARNSAGVVVFRDQQHLTDSFVRAQVPAIKLRLLKMGLGSLLQDSS